MIILLIEDDGHKSLQVSQFVRTSFPSDEVIEKRSYQSGMKALTISRPDVVLLDMALPTFDVVDGEVGGRMRNFGGRDVLVELDREGIPIKAIIITQFDTFGEGRDQQTLAQLANEIQSSFPHLYSGTVYYHPARSDWRTNLLDLLTSIKTSPTKVYSAVTCLTLWIYVI